MELSNDTIINVAQLMKSDLGSTRHVTLDLDQFPLDDDLLSKDVHGDLRLTRITHGILASGTIRGTALVECVRCLEMYEQEFEADFDQEYRPLIDVRSGMLVDQPAPEEEFGMIDEVHELDLAEPMRQVAILALPIKPVCREDCPGLPEANSAAEETGDRRLGVLSQLLETENDEESAAVSR